jgi:hypothetical protein
MAVLWDLVEHNVHAYGPQDGDRREHKSATDMNWRDWERSGFNTLVDGPGRNTEQLGHLRRVKGGR